MKTVYILILLGICVLCTGSYFGSNMMNSNIKSPSPTPDPNYCNETNDCLITHYCKNNKCVLLDETFRECRMTSQCEKPKKCKEINPPDFIGYCL